MTSMLIQSQCSYLWSRIVFLYIRAFGLDGSLNVPSAPFASQGRSEAAPSLGCHERRYIGAQRIHRDPTRRAVFNCYGCTVYGRPSKGSVAIRACADSVEVEYLGFNKFDCPAKRFEDQANEDKFCI